MNPSSTEATLPPTPNTPPSGKTALRDFTCILCGCAEAENWRIADGHPLVRCRTCGLTLVHPQPTDLEREGQYKVNDTAPAYYAATARLDGPTFHHRMHMIEKFSPKGRMLDIGCNIGMLMDVAAQRGWQVAGIEPNQVAVQHAQKRGLNVVQGFLSATQADALKNSFDLVNMFDVIEHFNDPAEAVRLTGRMLKPGGFFSLSTPNLRSWIARCFQVKPLEHLFYFDAGTLTLLLEQNGFKVEWIKKTTRRRDFKNILSSHTHFGPVVRLCVRAVIALGLAELSSWIWAQTVQDELWVLAKKRG